MFEYSFVRYGKTRRPLLVATAGLGEAMLVAGLALAPMFFVQALPDRALFNALILAPVPTAPPKPPPPMVAKRIPRAVPVSRTFNPNVLVSPVVVPKVVALINDAPPLELEAMPAVPGWIPGVAVGGVGTGVFGKALPMAPSPPPPLVITAPAAPPATAAAPRQIKVGGDVQAALILNQVQPGYPSLARRAHISGSVKLRAVIGTDGRIKNLTALSGHSMLVAAAMDAVRKWIYQPTVLDGEPVEVNTEIEVRFGLTSPAEHGT